MHCLRQFLLPAKFNLASGSDKPMIVTRGFAALQPNAGCGILLA
jgi:hypothetical protein